MRFRFFRSNLNPIRKSYVSRISLQANNSFYPVFGALSSPSNDYTLVCSENPNFKIWKRWHLGHSDDHSHQDLRSVKEGERIFRLGLAADVGFAAGKALTGYLSGNTAIIADAAHSVSDVIMFVCDVLGSQWRGIAVI